MNANQAAVARMAMGLLLVATIARAEAIETTITGVISKVDPVTRIATVTPAKGAPIVVQFEFDTGGPCNTCIGSGRSGPTFAETVTEGSMWTLTYMSSIPAGAATWFPGGTVNTVFRAVPVKAK